MVKENGGHPFRHQMETKIIPQKMRSTCLTLFGGALLLTTPLAQAQPGSAPLPTFTRVSITGLPDPAGVAWMDYDQDGYLDLVVANGAASSGAHLTLYHNDGQGHLVQVTTGPVVSDPGAFISAAWGDYDNDGVPDLIAGKFPETGTDTSFLYHNQGAGSFARITTGDLATRRGSYIGLWGDYDNDGFLDLLLVNSGGNNLLFRNNRDGTFASVSGSGLTFSFQQADNVANSATWGDFDNDGYLDLFVFGGSGQNKLFHNNGNGTFTALSPAAFPVDRTPTVGAAWVDYDNDGFLDLFLANGNFDTGGYHNSLFHNNGNGTFSPVTTGPIVSDRGSSVAGAWEDFDNDGYLDLFVSRSNGSGNIATNSLYHNNGDGTFTTVTNTVLAEKGGFAAAAWGDVDNDGFPDLFVSSAGASSPLYHNNGNRNHWLTVQPMGTVSNRSAIGAKVRIKAVIAGQSVRQMRQISNGDALNGSALYAHFGLGDAAQVDSVTIEWPSGTVQELTQVPANQFLTVTEPSRFAAPTPSAVGTSLVLRGGRGMNYEVDASPNLKSWNVLSTITITNLDGTAVLVDTNRNSAPRTFYRALSVR
jgi:hypothetical protein